MLVIMIVSHLQQLKCINSISLVRLLREGGLLHDDSFKLSIKQDLHFTDKSFIFKHTLLQKQCVR